MNKKQLQQMIEMLVESVLIKEKDDASKTSGIDLSSDTASAPDDSGGDVDASPDVGDVGDTTTGVGVDGTSGTDVPSEGDELISAAGDDMDAGAGSSGGGFSGGGGGGGGSFSGGGGGGFDSTSSDDSADNDTGIDNESENDDIIDDITPLDPIQDTIDMAVSLSKEIGDHQIILNVIKSKMQKYFPDFDDAIPIIQGLWDTNDPNLKIVARKLIMFIKGD